MKGLKDFLAGREKENIGQDGEKIYYSGDLSLVIYPRRSGRC